MNANRFRAVLLLVAASGSAAGALAQTGGGFDLSWNTFDGGGATFSTGGVYSLGGTAGQPDAGNHALAPFALSGGFWFAPDAAFVVAKNFSDDSTAGVTVTLTCTSGVVSPPTATATEAAAASFTVSGYLGAPTCTATESVPAGYTANQTGCANVALSTGTCTIVNTLNGGGFSVSKDFSDDNTEGVTVSLSCTSGVVSPLTATASEVAPASFSVTGYTGTPTCTATETVPPGYTANQAGCVDVSLTTGTCTIVNTAIPGTISIVQTTVPSPDPSGTLFAFTAGGGLTPTSFSLANGGVQTFSGVAPGSGYSVAQTVPPGWILTSATCSDGSSPSNIDLGRDESVTCTFVTALLPVIPVLDGTGLTLLMSVIAAAALAALHRRHAP